MNTQMDRPRGQSAYGEHPHDQDVGLQIGQGHDEGEHHGEKKSVLKKVKARAKKIKNSFTGHGGHGHGHDHDEDDDDDSMDTDPEVHDSHSAEGLLPGQGGATRQHGNILAESTSMERATHVPVSKPQGYQTSDTSGTKYIPGQEETLSVTDTGSPTETEERHRIIGSTPVASHPGGDLSTGDLGMEHKGNLGGGLEKDPHEPTHAGEGLHPVNYQPKVTDPTARGGYDSAAAQGLLPGQGGTAMQHENTLAGHSAMEGAAHVPVSKPVDYQTFDTSSDKYIPGQEETLGWSRTDTGRPRGAEEMHHTTGNIPAAQLGEHLDRRAGHESENLTDILRKPSVLEKDPHSPREVGERPHAENYQSKVTDPTGKGGKEMGVPPIVDQLGEMDIHDHPNRKQTTESHMEEQESLFKPSIGHDEKLSTGSHDQFSPEPISPRSSFLQASKSNSQPEENEGSYTEKIAAAASMVADKAKQATTAVTSKLGYGSSGEQLYTPTTGPIDKKAVPESLDKRPVKGPLDKEPVPGGYGGTLSSVGTAIADTATSAKDAVASKLGYGGTHTEQAHYNEGASKSGSITDYGKKVASTVQEKLTPVYDKVVEIGSTVASKVPGSGTASVVHTSNSPTLVPDSETTREVPSTVTADKGVSVKDYMVQKLKPSEEDKALSEVITEALPLHKRKDNVSDIKKDPEGKTVEIKEHVTESEGTRKVEIKGRVKESEEVAQRLGRSEETDYDGVGPGLASPGKGVMDRIKDAASTWLTRSGETTELNTASGNYSSEDVVGGNHQNQGVGEPRLE